MMHFVTGATGFVGSAVARALLARGDRVRVLVRSASNQSNIAGLPVDIALGDIRDPASLKAAMRGCDSVFNVAADYRHWARNPQEIYDANVGGTQNILNAARELKIARFVHTSSVGAMGLEDNGAPASEATPVTLDDIIGPYHRSKYLADQLVHAAAEEGFNAVLVAPTMPIGPRDIKPTPTGRIIVEAASGRLPAYVDTGLNIVHVDDVAAGHVLAFERGKAGETYILGAENMSLQALLALVGDVMGRPASQIRIPHAVAYPVAVISEAIAWFTGHSPVASLDEVRLARRKMFFSSQKAIAELGFAPQPARQAVSDAIAWFSAHHYLTPGAGLFGGRPVPDLAQDASALKNLPGDQSNPAE